MSSRKLFGITIQQLPIVLLLLLCTAIQLPSVFSGLPYYFNSDEVHIVSTVLSMLEKHSLNPEWFGHPAQPIIYSLSLLYGLEYLIGLSFGAYNSPQDFSLFLSDNPEYVLVPGRLLILLAILNVVWTTNKIGSLHSRLTGLFAALTVVLSPLFIVGGTAIRNSDIVMAMFSLWALFFCLKALDDPSIKNYLWASISVGAATVTKYPGVFSAILPIAAYLTTFGFRASRLSLLFISGAASLVTAFILAPYIFLDFHGMLNSVAGEARATHVSATGEGFIFDLAFLIGRLVSKGVGSACIAFALVGILTHFRSKRKLTIIVLAFPTILLLFFAGLYIRWERWLIPLIPFVAIFSGIGLSALRRFFNTLPINGFAQSLLLLGAVFVAIFQPAKAAIDYLSNQLLPDTRVIASEWILDNIYPGAGLFIEMHGPQLPGNAFNFFSLGEDSLLKNHTKNRLSTNFIPRQSLNEISGKQTMDGMRNEGVNYVILTSFYGRYIKDQARIGGQKKELMYYNSFIYNSETVYEISPEPGAFRGPPIKVLRLP